jgi:hypothetical protein
MEQSTYTDLLLVLHIVLAMLMAWPYYALAAVNQRVKLGPPLGDRTDRYMENILKNRTTACFVFQFTILAGGFALIWSRVHDGVHDGNWYLTNKVVVAKIVILLLMAASLSVVRFIIQPEIDRLFGDYGEIDEDSKKRIMSLRVLRKRMSSVCMFMAFTAAMLGMQTYFRFPYWVTAVLLALIALWTWRSYSSTTEYGWV